MEAKTKLSEMVPSVGDFVRMPKGSEVFYPVHDFSVMSQITSYSSRVGGHIAMQSIYAIDPTSEAVQKLIRCTVKVPGKKRSSTGPKRAAA